MSEVQGFKYYLDSSNRSRANHPSCFRRNVKDVANGSRSWTSIIPMFITTTSNPSFWNVLVRLSSFSSPIAEGVSIAKTTTNQKVITASKTRPMILVGHIKKFK